MKTTGFLLWTLQLSFVSADSRIFHRVWDPLSPPPPFTLRANLQLSNEFGPVLVAPDDSTELLLTPEHGERALYQVALERHGDLSEADWDLSSVKACHLANAQSDIIQVHLSSSKVPYALDLFVHPILHDGICPKTPIPRKSITLTNTTLTLQFASSPPLPELRLPPPLSPQGEPIQPVPEKTFLQKYWLYIGAGLLAIMLAGGAPPEDESTGASGAVQGRGAVGGRPAGR